jgi:hypothetical protein
VTPEEVVAREQIRHTISSYTYFADRGLYDDVAGLFADDGVLEVEGVGAVRVEGRDAIRRFFRSVGNDVTGDDIGRMQHHVAGVWIEVTSPREARAASYFSVLTAAGLDHWGRYRDRLVAGGSTWRFAHRLVRTDGVAPGGWAAARRGSPDQA